MNTESFRYKAFVSYSRGDGAFAVDLHRRLERFVMPLAMRKRSDGLRHERRPLRPIFLDDGDLVPGASLPERIADAISSSEYLVLVCSPGAAQRPWVQEEVRLFLQAHGVEKIVCVVCSGEPMAEGHGQPAELECFPEPYLEAIARAGAEPLWIDARARRRIERVNLLRVVAAIFRLGSLDELLQRDKARRIRDAMLAAAIALFVLIALALTAWVSNRNAAIGDAEALERLAAVSSESGDQERAARYLLESMRLRKSYLDSSISPLAEALMRRVYTMSRMSWFMDFDSSEGGMMKYSRDGTAVIVSDINGDKLYNVRGKNLIMARGVDQLSFALGGRYAVSANEAGDKISVFNLAGKTVGTIDVDTPISRYLGYRVAVSEDGKRAAIEGDYAVSLYDVSANKGLATYTTDGSIVLSPTAQWAVSTRSNGDKQLDLIRLNDGRRTSVLGSDPVFSSNGALLAVMTKGHVSIIDLATGGIRAQTPEDVDGVGDMAFDLGSAGRSFAEYVFSSDGDRIGICHLRICKAWNTQTGTEVARYERDSLDTALPIISPDGTRLAVHEGGRIDIVDFSSGFTLLQIPVGTIEHFEFAPDGMSIAIAKRGGGGLAFYDLRNLPKPRTFKRMSRDETENDDSLAEPEMAENSASTAYLVDRDDGVAEVLDKQRKPVFRLTGRTILDVDRNLQWAIINSDKRGLTLRRLNTDAKELPLQLPDEEVKVASFSPDGKKVVLIGVGHPAAIAIIDVASGARVSFRKSWSSVHTQPVFSNDGKYFAALSQGTPYYPGAPVEVWRAATGELIGTLARSMNEPAPGQLIFLNPSRYVATASDAAIAIWDLEAMTEIVRYPSPHSAGEILLIGKAVHAHTAELDVPIPLPSALALKKEALSRALCSDRLDGALRRLTAADIALAPMLRARLGTDVCA